MKETQARLNDYEWLSIVPAGGMGTRLGKLTERRAKPSQAVAYDENGEITRMIDIPLRAIRDIGGAAIVSRCYAAETLDFVRQYDHVEIVRSCSADSPIDTLLVHLSILEDSTAEHIGLIPADANISSQILEKMRVILDTTGMDAVLLATRHLEGHNIRRVDENGLMCAPSEGVESIGDMGVHIFRRDWLLQRLHTCFDDDPDAPREVWNDIYDVNDLKGRVYLYVPNDDLKQIDMGTPAAFRQVVEELNASRRDENGNIIFPGAELHPESVDCIALPGSFATAALSKVIVPEKTTVYSPSDCLEA
jgi:hypothetical protein